MEELRSGEEKNKSRRRRRRKRPLEKSEEQTDTSAAAAADDGTSECVETYLPAQLSFLDDEAEDVRDKKSILFY